jgi:HSF-type DNA-binding
MSMISRRVSNAGTGECPVPSVVVSRQENGGYPRSNNAAAALHHGNSVMQSRNSMHRLHQQHPKVDDMMMNEFGTMGDFEPNALDMESRFNHGRPVDAGQSGGPMMDRLMDFPNQMFIPTMRRPYSSLPHHNVHPQPQQQHMTSYSNGPMDDFTMDPFSHKIPVYDSERFRTTIRTNRPASEEAWRSSSLMPSSNLPTSGKRKSRRPSTTSFPTKLYKILSEPKYQEYIAWLPHGRAWRVLKPKALEDDIIPKYFRSDRLASFMRQVNGWGFKRITEGPDLNAYYHEMFLRGLPHVCNKMRRPVKGESGMNRDLGQHPDFYKISMFAPLPEVGTSTDEKDSDFEIEVESTPTSAKKQTITLEKSPGVVSSDGANSKSDESARGNGLHAGNDSHENIDCSSASDDHTIDGGVFITSASLESPPDSPQADGSVSRNTPTAYFDGLNGGAIHRTPSGNSLSSWNDQQDSDLMWGGHSVGSPSSGAGQWHQTEPFRSFANVNGFGQVTPPGGPDGIAYPNKATIQLQPRHEHIRLPFNGMGMRDDGIDDTGLSAADLCYLTQQNRILLSQAQGRPDSTK